MGESTGIEWCDATFNAVWGCQEIAPECNNCYARTWDKRTGGKNWGPKAPRRTFGLKHWHQPLLWNKRAIAEQKRLRVFSSSMGDNFEDHPIVIAELAKLWRLISRTPALDWLLLTKRANRIFESLPTDWGDGWSNVWMGVTAGTQKGADLRIPRLIEIPAAIRFLSMEPLLETVELRDEWMEDIHWVIVGGESGSKSRPFDISAARRIRDQCADHGVKFFCKQMGARPTIDGVPLVFLDRQKGKDSGDWPADLRIQEFPARKDR